MLRDIDYAAKAVRVAVVDKFGKDSDLNELEVTAHDRTISIHDGDHNIEGTRDSLLAAIRKSASYDELWTAES